MVPEGMGLIRMVLEFVWSVVPTSLDPQERPAEVGSIEFPPKSTKVGASDLALEFTEL